MISFSEIRARIFMIAIGSSIVGFWVCLAAVAAWQTVSANDGCRDRCGEGVFLSFLFGSPAAFVYGIILSAVAFLTLCAGKSRTLFVAATLVASSAIVAPLTFLLIAPKVGHYFALGWTDPKLPQAAMGLASTFGVPMSVALCLFLLLTRRFTTSESTHA